jgi:hypothetical protein
VTRPAALFFLGSSVTIPMPSVIFAHRDDCVPMSNVAASIRARDLDLVHTSIGSIPLFSIGYFRAQFDVMRIDDPIVPGGQ